MKSDPTSKSRLAVIMRGVARRSERRNQKGGLDNPNAEEIAQIFHRGRADREAKIPNAKATGDWLPISEIISAVAAAKGARFDKKKLNKIEIEVCRNIVADSANGRLGSKQAPALMLLSSGYDETPLSPADLAQALKVGFDDLNGDEKMVAIAKFLTDDCWMKRRVAEQWLPGISLPPHIRPAQERILANALDEKKCKEWLKSEMEAHKEPPKRRQQYLEEAKQRYGVGPRPFRRAWDDAIKETASHHWRNPGRPKKS